MTPRAAARVLVAALIVATTLLALAGCNPATFQNPIKGAGADPYVVRWHHGYYLVESRDGGIWVTRSPRDDLVGIASGTAERIWTFPTSGPACADLWAPELHRIGSRWFVYYAATTCDGDNANHRMFALESATDDPQGAFTNAGAVTDAADRWAIDGTRFRWHGIDYFVWSGWPGGSDGQQDLYIARMSSPTRLVGTGVRLSTPTRPFERHGAPIEEGPQALIHDGVLRIVYSASGSWTDHYGYGMLTATSDDLLSPRTWQKSPVPVFASDDEATSPGHGSFVKSPDGTEDWMVYHVARYRGAGWDRQIDAQRFTWSLTGAPVFGRPVGDDVAQAIPSRR
ncbi:family 43 glycosylhydrolase [uncultured Amnibacterium sp.]|uniref:glycoside hydrolase family 43 protein n=1 Tax=uncultured Amnibacterium sp. TaxID=1631851 RepID=UPI0035CB38EC